MSKDKSWREQIMLVDAYKAIGHLDHYLMSDDENDRPWEFVDEIENGGRHRHSISVSVNFHATHPSGLTFSWSVDLETPDANGRSGYHIKIDHFRTVAAKLPARIRAQFVTHLAAVADALDAKAAEAFEFGRGQAGQAAALRALATTEMVTA